MPPESGPAPAVPSPKPIMDVAAPRPAPAPTPLPVAPQPAPTPNESLAPLEAPAQPVVKTSQPHIPRTPSTAPVGIITVTIIIMLLLAGIAVAIYLQTP